MHTPETITSFNPVHPALRNVVNSYVVWRQYSTSPQHQILLPNNISGFGITLRGSFYVKGKEGFRLMPVAGTRNTMELPSEIYTIGDFFNISVRMKMPHGMHRFIKAPAHELYHDLAFDLDNVFSASELERLTCRLQECHSNNEMILLLESFLLQKLQPDVPYFYGALVDYIHKQRGLLSIYDISGHFGISERTVHRLFLNHAGISPKAYINLMRFRNVIDYSKQHNFKPLEAALEAGFFDQSHFIKLFRKLSSITPGKFFSAKRPDQLFDLYSF